MSAFLLVAIIISIVVLLSLDDVVLCYKKGALGC